MNTVTSVIVGILVIIGVGSLVYYQKSVNDAAMQESGGSSNDWGNLAIKGAQGTAMGDDDEVEDEDGGAVTGQPTTGAGTAGGSSSGSTGGLPAGLAGGITAVTVAQHNSRASCWSSINGNVYDLTSWIPKHPGGEQAILQLCGTDGSAKFNKQHGSGAQQAAVLAGFKIGVLAN